MSTMTEQETTDFRQKCVDFMETYAVKTGNAIPTLDDQKAFLAAAAGAGLAGIPYPEEYGGGGYSCVDTCLASEALARGGADGGKQLAFRACCLLLATHGQGLTTTRAPSG